jgi:DNA-binding CsgD family transcriptional regulator
VQDDVEILGLTRRGPPMRLRDMPVDPAETRGWAECLWPAGFREGLGVSLYTPDGRQVGLLGMNTESAAHPTDCARDVVGALQPLIAHALDPMRTVAVTAQLVGDAQAGILLTREGVPLIFPGLPTHHLLAPGSDVLAVSARYLAEGGVHTAFLCPVGTRDDGDSHVRIQVMRCPPRAPHHIVGVVLMSPSPDQRGLTRRELQILGLIVDGWSNRRIAGTLFVTPRTVATHIEHILVKLGARTRTVAAIRAFRQALYVPYPLAGRR